MNLSCAKTLTVMQDGSPHEGRSGLWIRTASGPDIGFGHLRRCMVLAQSLLDCSSPLFLLNPHDHWSREQLANQGCNYFCESLDNPWSVLTDPAAILIDTRIAEGLSRLITTARNRGIPVISIHDLGLNPLPSDIVIDGSIAPASSSSATRDARFFLGTDYMVLDPAYKLLHQQQRKMREKIGIVVINLGGGCFPAYFRKTLEGLKQWGREVEVIGVKGFTSWGQEALAEMEWKPLHFRWESGSIGRCLFNADIAITAGGLSGYEALCAGTPLLALSCDHLQQVTVSKLSAAGACVDLGPGDELDPSRLAGTLAALDADCEKRKHLSLKGRSMVDGRGAERVSQIIRQSIHARVAADRQEVR